MRGDEKTYTHGLIEVAMHASITAMLPGLPPTSVNDVVAMLSQASLPYHLNLDFRRPNGVEAL
jgi:hypothetical protein